MKIKLLVVDDETSICDMLSRHFRYLGYEVATAYNGVEALEYLSKNKIDIMTTDIMMPEMDGVELTARVKDEYPLVRTIVITGYVTLSNAMACMQNGADALFAKPLEDLEPLEKAVKRAGEMTQAWVTQLAELHIHKPRKN